MTTQDAPLLDVYLSVRYLPENCRPAHLIRDGDYRLLMVDPRDSREGITLWCLDHLTAGERDLYTRAYEQEPGALDPAFLEGDCLQHVPAALRLPWEPAVQPAMAMGA